MAESATLVCSVCGSDDQAHVADVRNHGVCLSPPQVAARCGDPECVNLGERVGPEHEHMPYVRPKEA